MKTQASLATAASLFASLASAVEYLAIDGSTFINNSTGSRFDLIGITYQPGGSSGFSGTADPLTDATACLRDAILMQQLGVNTVRVYNLSPDLNHDECASIFNAAGIYMIIDVNTGLSGQYIDRSDPASTYTLEYMDHVFRMVEAFMNYPNLLGFFSGNEIINEEAVKLVPAYIRAVTRDMKEYISLHAPRAIGVGYAAADVTTQLGDTWTYLGCELENSTFSKIDFFGLNDYSWCGDSSFTQSGYNTKVTRFQDSDIPVFFSEYGCNLVSPRTFTNVPTIYGPDMTVLSGGLVYEYTQEPSNYGLVAINSSKEITLLQDYDYLQKQYATIDMSVITSANKTMETVAVTSCAASLIEDSSFLADWDLPTRPNGGDDLVTSGVASASTGTITSVTATDMPATVYNYTGATVTGLSLLQYGCADSNYPGLVATYSAEAQTCAYTSSPAISAGSSGGSGSSSNSDSNSDSDSASAAAGFDYRAVAMVGTLLTAFIGGLMIL